MTNLLLRGQATNVETKDPCKSDHKILQKMHVIHSSKHQVLPDHVMIGLPEMDVNGL